MSLSVRVHRALSWLYKAKQESIDLDAQFIFLWVAFNAAYANEIEDRKVSSERRMFQSFLKRLVESGSDNIVVQLGMGSISKDNQTLDRQPICLSAFLVFSQW